MSTTRERLQQAVKAAEDMVVRMREAANDTNTTDAEAVRRVQHALVWDSANIHSTLEAAHANVEREWEKCLHNSTVIRLLALAREDGEFFIERGGAIYQGRAATPGKYQAATNEHVCVAVNKYDYVACENAWFETAEELLEYVEQQIAISRGSR